METHIQKKYLIPSTIEEAITMAASPEYKSKYIAGGTDIMVNKYHQNDETECLIDISKISKLKEIKIEDHFLKIGSLTSLQHIAGHLAVLEYFPALSDAATAVGSPLIRNTATIGGNVLCENRCWFYNQSEWWREAAGLCLKCEGTTCIATGGKKSCFSKSVSDTAPCLICYDAHLEVADSNGSRLIRLEDIYTGDGLKPLNLPPSLLIVSVHLPLNRKFKSVFKKLKIRESLDFTSLTTCVSIDDSHTIRISLSGVDPKVPVIKTTLEEFHEQKLIDKALKLSRSVNNEILARTYRREMITVFLKQSFKELNIC